MSWPPTSGPTIAPSRPTPLALPMAVARVAEPNDALLDLLRHHADRLAPLLA